MSSPITISEIKASNAKITTKTAPRTAVFIGATAGIGKAALTRLVAQQITIRVYIIGRDASKQQNFISQLRASNRNATIIFLQGEVSLLAEVKRICDEIKSKETSLDAIFLSTGWIAWNGREMTSENIDLMSALGLYSRLLFTLHLLPLLKASQNSPRIVHLGGTGQESTKLFLDDLDLHQPGHYSMWNNIYYTATAMTLILSRLADENPDVTFVLGNPGLVGTNIQAGAPWYGRLAVKLLGMKVEVAGERSLFLLTSARFGGRGVEVQEGKGGMLSVKGREREGLFCVSYKMGRQWNQGVMGELEKMGAGRRIWEHVMGVLGAYL